MNVNFQPKGYTSVIPYLIVRGADEAVKFYQHIFGAKEILRIDAPGGKVGHSELAIGDMKIFLADECPEGEFLGPLSIGGTAISLVVYVEDVDTVFERAVEHGSKAIRPVADQFYGDRSGSIQDPFGHIWNIATHQQDMTHDEMRDRAKALFGG